MQLKTFTAPTIADAMQQVREQLGRDAIILSTDRSGRSVRITAGVQVANGRRGLDPRAAVGAVDAVGAALEFHRVPAVLADRLLTHAADLLEDSAEAALAAALDAVFVFAPAAAREERRPVMLVGAPGAGKTVTLAKLAADEHVMGLPVAAVTCDVMRAGAVEQLATYARLLHIPAYKAKDRDGLARALEKAPVDALVLIDTMGANAWHEAEMKDLDALREIAGATVRLVLPAGGDVAESTEQAQSFAGIGATGLIFPKVDAARRLGGVLAAAFEGKLPLCAAGTSPQISNGLEAMDGSALAALLLATPASASGNTNHQNRTGHGKTPRPDRT